MIQGKKKSFGSSSVGRNVAPNSPRSGSADFKPAVASIKELTAQGFIVHWDGNENLFGDLHNALSADNQAVFKDFLTKLADLGKQISSRTQGFNSLVIEKEAEFKAIRNEIIADRSALQEEASQLTIDRQTFQEQNQKLKNDEIKIESDTVRLSNWERDLIGRESEAESKFARLNEKSMEGLRGEMTRLQQSRTALESEIHSVRTCAFNQLDIDLEARRSEIVSREGAIDGENSRIAASTMLLQNEQREFEREKKTYDELRRLLRDQIEKEFQTQLEVKREEVEKLKAQATVHNEELDKLGRELDAFSDLTEQLGGKTAQDVIKELTQLRADLKIKTRRILVLESERATDDGKQVEDERDQLRLTVTNLTTEVEELRQKEHTRKLGVMEKERLAQEKNILEKTKQLLSAHITDLETRIKGLTESQQSQNAFPELSKMDTESSFRMPASVQRVPNLSEFTRDLRHRIAASQPDNPLYFREIDLQLFVGGLAMSQLHVLQGISGTGKTSLAKAFATAVGGVCKDIAVQAGWRDRGDLLGHYNAFEKRYYEKECLQALYLARTPCAEDRVNVILLDEMNLSRPEQYFADFLSALEKEVESRYIPLIESAPPGSPKMLKDGREILVPENVWFIGTANQDETTSELADKTQDRAFVMELPRQEDDFQINRGLESFTCSVSSLKKAFATCQKADHKDLQKAMQVIRKSDLTKELEDRFGLGWGNRFERQALKFLPVVKACGGSHEAALDHLMATRIFRKGKVTDRYDIKVDDLDVIEKALVKTLRGIFPGIEPERCKASINRDRQRLIRLEHHG